MKRLQHALVIAEKIQALEAELASILGQSSGASSVMAAAVVEPKTRKTRKTRKKRFLSPEAREKIAAAQRARWAKVKAKKKG
jgi:hypothetical protein